MPTRAARPRYAMASDGMRMYWPLAAARFGTVEISYDHFSHFYPFSS
jgi:hypothetical protein